MNLEKAIELYKSAKEQTEKARLSIKQEQDNLKDEIENTYRFGIEMGKNIDRDVVMRNGLHFHEDALKKAEDNLIAAFKEEALNNPICLKKCEKLGLKKDEIYLLFEESEYQGIRLLITELAILTA